MMKRGSRKKQPQAQQSQSQFPMVLDSHEDFTPLRKQPQQQYQPSLQNPAETSSAMQQQQQQQRRRQNEEVAVLTTKNYRLAKELVRNCRDWRLTLLIPIVVVSLSQFVVLRYRPICECDFEMNLKMSPG
jgi:hypothetical protein